MQSAEWPAFTPILFNSLILSHSAEWASFSVILFNSLISSQSAGGAPSPAAREREDTQARRAGREEARDRRPGRSMQERERAAHPRAEEPSRKLESLWRTVVRASGHQAFLRVDPQLQYAIFCRPRGLAQQLLIQEVCSLEDPWPFASSNSLRHSMHRCTGKSLQFFIIIIMMASFMRVSTAMYTSSSSFVYLCFFSLYCDAC